MYFFTGQDQEVVNDTGREAAHPPIARDDTAPLVPGRREEESGTGKGSVSIDTKMGIARAHTLTGARGRGEAQTDRQEP